MKKFYIPTSSLNFTNILSSESISPKAFYMARSFGIGRWETISENPYQNSIVLYDELRSFNRPISDVEDHPLLIEIVLHEQVEATLMKITDNLYLCDRTIYIDPFSTRLLFFTEKDKTIALSISDASSETKFVHLYRSRIQVIPAPVINYQPITDTKEVQNFNTKEVESDKRINRMKGLLYGYYIGALLSTSKELVVKLNAAREINDIYAAILASLEHKATPQQKNRLENLFLTIHPVPFISKLKELITDKRALDAIVSLVREEYGNIKGEVNVDKVISQLLSSSNNPDIKNPIIVKINNFIKQLDDEIARNAKPISPSDDNIVVTGDSLKNIKGLSDNDKSLYITWINETLTKDEYNGKISTFREALSDDITRKAKDIIGSDSWKGSRAEVTLNALRRHVRGEGFQHNWGNDVLSSIAAVVVRGEDWQKLLEYMQSKEMTEYQIAFSMYGTLNGFANLLRDFTDVLFSQKSSYIVAVYKEFYGQLFFRDIISINDDIPSTNANEIPALDEDMPKEYNSAQSQIDQDFGNFMIELTGKCSGAKKDEPLYKSFYIKHCGATIGFVEDVKKCTDFNNGKGVQKGVIKYLNKLVKPLKTVKPSSRMVDNTASLFPSSETSTGNFLSDFDFLVNNTQFSYLMNSADPREWKDDLKWFIDAHEPSHKDYRYYNDKGTDNNTLISQFIRFKKSKYHIVEEFLRNLYCK